MTTGIVRDQNLEKHIHKQMGCMAGFLQIFDRHQMLTGKRIYSPKRLPPVITPPTLHSHNTIPLFHTPNLTVFVLCFHRPRLSRRIPQSHRRVQRRRRRERSRVRSPRRMFPRFPFSNSRKARGPRGSSREKLRGCRSTAEPSWTRRELSTFTRARSLPKTTPTNSVVPPASLPSSWASSPYQIRSPDLGPGPWRSSRDPRPSPESPEIRLCP